MSNEEETSPDHNSATIEQKEADAQINADPEAEPQQDADDGATEANNQHPKPILYNLNISPVVRCVKIVARLIDLELELRYEYCFLRFAGTLTILICYHGRQ